MNREVLYNLVPQLRSLGLKQAKIAEFLSITQARVSQILKNPIESLPQWGGHRGKRLNNIQIYQLLAYLELGAEFFGFVGNIWDSKRVKWVIKDKLGIDYHQDYIPTLLRSIGYSHQKPKVSDYRQDEEKVKIYQEQTLPALKKKAQEEDRKILYVDEAGFYLSVKLSKTWAPKGQTPILKEGCRYKHLSAISAISVDGQICYQIKNSNFLGVDIVVFLKELLAYFNQKLLIIWDGASIHSDENVKNFLTEENQDRIYLAKIPPYSPELNADEQVWQTLKDDNLKNVVCKNLTELKGILRVAFEKLKEQPQKIASFFRHPEVSFYKT